MEDCRLESLPMDFGENVEGYPKLNPPKTYTKFLEEEPAATGAIFDMLEQPRKNKGNLSSR